MTGQSYPQPVVQEPSLGFTGSTLNHGYQYDAAGRLTNMTTDWGDGNGAWQTVNATYGQAGQLTGMTGYNPFGGVTETRSYNVMLQLTGIQGGWGGMNLQYVYSATQNNGRIAQTIDNLSGEQVSYQYDALNRLIHAETASSAWGETYTYDGFGNLTSKTPTKGSAPALSASYDPATNRLAGWSYDANGNVNSGAGLTWDSDNRLVAQTDNNGNPVQYLYDPWGKRVGKKMGNSGPQSDTYEFVLYGIDGRRLVTERCAESGYQVQCSATQSNIYFGGRLLLSTGGVGGNGYVQTDRLGSVSTGSAYFPYGEERAYNTPTGTDRFGSYYRDWQGQDYADQRYYDSTKGRFFSPDAAPQANLSDPTSWNRYIYAGDDPINHMDPNGTDWVCTGPADDRTCTWYPDPPPPGGAAGMSGISMAPNQTGVDEQGRDERDAQRSAIERAKAYLPTAADMIRQALNTNSDCAALFGGGASTATTLLTGLLSGSIGVIQFGDIDGDAYTLGRPKTEVYFDDGSIKFQYVDININSSISGSGYWNQVGDVGRAKTLLHELGHVANLYVQGGGSQFKDDYNNPDNQKFNQDLETKCFK